MSSFLGSTIEYYDFLLYATASALVFNTVFFPQMDPLLGTVASLGTFAVGYIARPIGGVLAGHLGDRVGRKAVLSVTMAAMGMASFLIGLLPPYSVIGVWAPILLVVLRVLQGLAIGGEWGGAVLISAEHATSRRALWASFTQAGAPAGQVLSTAVLAATVAATTDEQFESWGWRIPFLLSLLLLAVGLYTRLKVAESPAFAAMQEKQGRSRFPLGQLLRRQPRNLLICTAIGLCSFVTQVTMTTFIISYAAHVGFDRQTVLSLLTVSSLVTIVTVLTSGALSDRVGRRPTLIVGALGMAGGAFAFFPMIDTGSTSMLFLAVILGQAGIHSLVSGPMPSLFAEAFDTDIRYTGASVAYQLAGLGGGVAPLLFAGILETTGDTIVISVIISVVCLLAAAGALWMKETRQLDLVTRHDPGI